MISSLRLSQRSCGFINRLVQANRSFVSASDVLGNQKTAAGPTQKKPKESPKITLMSQNNSVSITTLVEAQKLAKRRDLFLVQEQAMDQKTQRPVYRLATAGEMLSSEQDEPANEKSAKSANKKSDKSLTIGARISEHDLSSRLKNIGKWLTKGHEVRILIQGGADSAQSAENIVKEIEKSIKEPQPVGKIVQKRSKGSMIKFSIHPVAPPAASSTAPTPQ